MAWSEKKKKVTGLILSCVLLFSGCTYSDYGTDSESDNQEEIQVHFIDVGQGDSSLIITDDFTVLIDAGEKGCGEIVNSYLAEHNIENLDYIIATHPHSDHIGGLPEVISQNDVGTVIIPHISDDKIPTTKIYGQFLQAIDDKDCKLEEAYTGEVINLGIAEMKVLAPVNDDYSDLNNFSVVTELEFENVRFLFTGDAETKSENEIIDSGMLESADVLKVGHHGSSSSSGEAFLDIVKPEYAVISCGEGNSYGHPNEDTIERLLKYTDSIYRTDLQGNIVFTSDGTDIEVDY